MSSETMLRESLRQAASLLQRVADELTPRIGEAAAMLIEALGRGGRVFFAGNGGSAAEAEHLAGELIGRFQGERRPLPAIALGTDLGVLTALANDYGYEEAYARQLEGLAAAGDVLVVLSTSGNSKNLVTLLQRAARLAVRRIGLLGRGGGRCRQLVDLAIVVPSDDIPHIQEAHLAIGHSLCAAIDAEFQRAAAPATPASPPAPATP